MAPRLFAVRLWLIISLLTVLPGAAQQQARQRDEERKPFAGAAAREERHSLLDEWKETRDTRSFSRLFQPAPSALGGTPIVGRPTMIINSSNAVGYTRGFLGEINNCDVDAHSFRRWEANTTYLAGDHASLGGNAMVQIGGTSGTTQPTCPSFGATVTDGSVTWICEGNSWGASRNYTAGMVTRPVTPYVGFFYQALNSGTSGSTEPLWATSPGATTTDNTITWKAIGNPQGTYRGCHPMALVLRASGGVETVVAQEGDALGDSVLSGWSERYDMNAAGNVAANAALSGILSDHDQLGNAIIVAGPATNSAAAVARTNEFVGGRYVCGFGAMVGINDAGQVVYNALTLGVRPTWQPSTSYPLSAVVEPTTPNGFRYINTVAGVSGSTEPVWPTRLRETVTDGTAVWRIASVTGNCDESQHGLSRFTPGTGNELLVAIGSTFGGSVVDAFGDELSNACEECYYNNIDGQINAAGHVPIVLHFQDGTQGVYNFTGPLTATEVARTGGTNPYTQFMSHTANNDADEVAFRGISGGAQRLFLFTPPALTTTVASVGDDIGTRTTGTASGRTITELGNVFDINNSGNVVFQAFLSGTQEAYFFWDKATGTLKEIYRKLDSRPLSRALEKNLAPEMITINDANVVAFVTGSQGYDYDVTEGPQYGGVYVWQGAGPQKLLALGDTVGGDTVTGLYAQHSSFAERQFNNNSCLAVAYFVSGDDEEFDDSLGGGVKGGQLFVACATLACQAIRVSPPLLPGAAQSVAYSQTVSATGGTAPYTFSVVGGGLPAGLTLNPTTGVISGTPTTEATYNFTIQALDVNNCAGTETYQIIVGPSTQVNISLSPTTLTEIAAGGTATFTVTITVPQTTDTTITLTSSNPSVVTVPATVTIPANQSSATFQATGVALGGPVTITAALPAAFNSQPAATYVSVTTKATTTLTTAVASATVLIGSSISDNATLSGGASPTGSIKFFLYGPDDATCGTTPVFSPTVAVTGNGVYNSGPFTPTTAGTYRFIASYLGDANNNTSTTACNDPNESVTVSRATPTLTTTASPAVTLGGSVSDSATLSGGFNPTGTITFRLFGPNDSTCSTAAVFTSTVTVNGNGNYTSATFTPTAAGTYRWTAIYSGDTNNVSAVSNCNAPNESVVVSPPAAASPTLVTTASPAVTIGGSISDSGTLSGGNNPTGSIVFRAFGPNNANCTGSPAFTATIPVSGNGTYNSGPFAPTAVGTYRWTASYGGDGNNNPATSPCNAPNESVVVNKASPTLTTTASPSVALGGSINDSATLAGGFNPTGNITFQLFGPNNATCTGTPIFTSTVPASGNGTYQSGSFTPTTAGTYQWVASYAGNANNNAANSPCGATGESVVVNKASPTLTTTASPSVALGGSIHDSATLAGGVNPTGNITFRLFGPNNATCTGTPIFTSTVPASGNGTYQSGSFTPTTAGTYQWVASYAGNTNNNAANSPCGATGESVVVTRATPGLTTTASPGVTLGGSVSDSATLSGGASPTGTITFRLFGPDNTTCTGTAAFTSTVAVAGNGVYNSGSFTPAAAGTYRWVATYNGDANNNPVANACGDPNETVVVSGTGPATPTLVTSASPRATIIGGEVRDVATLSGGNNPTGTITFSLFGPNPASCTEAPVFTSTVTVNGNGTYTSGAFTPTITGFYQWVARYNGSPGNSAVTTSCNDPNESVEVRRTTPTLITAASLVPGGARDTATLSFGFGPTGTITFDLFGPNNANCTGAPAFTGTVPVSGNGIYTSPVFNPTATGTYHFVARYSGDANNNPTANACGDPNERIVIARAPAVIQIVASPPIDLGGSVSQTVTLSGGTNPTGSLTFTAFGPNNNTCTGTPVFTATVPVEGNGSYTSPPFTPPAIGSYRFVVSYSGDAGNAPVTTPCGAPNSIVVVACGIPPAPLPSVVGEATSGRTYTVEWNAIPGAAAYDIDEATNDSFINATTQRVTGTSVLYNHTAPNGARPFFYRVRAIGACNQAAGPYSDPIRIVIIPPADPNDPGVSVNVPFGNRSPVAQQVFFPGVPGKRFQFMAQVDKPWLSVVPTSGILPPEGITLEVTADPTDLSNGTFTGTVILTTSELTNARRLVVNQTSTTTSKTVSVNLVTPITNVPTTVPQPNSLIIPAVGHLDGINNSHWQSDVRVNNPSLARQSYQLVYTQASPEGVNKVKVTTISADAGETIALDDIVRNWYGIGSLGDSSNGYLEIRPVIPGTSSGPTLNKAVASSRTYNTSNKVIGTLGQFVPAIPFTSFIGLRENASTPPRILSLQQITQSADFRTNLGLVEAAGKPTSVLLSVFNPNGTLLRDVPVDLKPGELKQISSILAQNNISLPDGRIQVQVTGGLGKVTAYASVIDNKSGMPMLVSGTPLGATQDTRYILPGIADFTNPTAKWRSDVRIFNSGRSSVMATVTLHPEANDRAPVTRLVNVDPGEIRSLDSIVQSVFGQTNVGGALHLVTPSASSLVVTGRTYNATPNGTLGQFVPAVTSSESVGRNDRALQILQTEESARFRTNLGLAEVTGRPVRVEVTVVLPDTKVTPRVEITLQPNEFRQLRILSSLGLGNVYNARIAVRVIDGDGRVTAYGSVIDAVTQAPTYVPAQ